MASPVSAGKKKRRRGGKSADGDASAELAALQAELQAEENAAELLELRAQLAQAQEASEALKAQDAPQPKRLKAASPAKPQAKAKPPAKAAPAKAPPAKAAAVKAPAKAAPTATDAATKRQRTLAALDGLPVCKVVAAPKEAEASLAQPKAAKRPLPAKEEEPEEDDVDAEAEEDGASTGWAALQRATARHARWKQESAAIEAQALADEAAKAGAWVRARPCGAWCAGLAHAYAIDCEMCVCQDPVTGAKSSKELIRVSIVDASDAAASLKDAAAGSDVDVVLDSLVSPSLPIVDCVTRVHGIKQAQLAGVTFTRRHAQAAMLKLVCDKTLLVGHALHNDLDSLRFAHKHVIDTACLFAVESTGATPALRDVAAHVLNAEHNQMATREHDSTVDARAAFLCAATLVDTPLASLPRSVLRTAQPKKEGAARDKANDEAMLFSHRIPSNVSTDELRDALALAAGVRPDFIHAIQRPPAAEAGAAGYGKTTLVFKSAAHANLAFDSLGDSTEQDKTGRAQKKLFLPASAPGAKPYCKVRKMIL
ncbi:hypothetical protein M885DRAFT_505526 [Pelagophyceae sp. CCMP2097]|nr:hypothetical protein M885DRAFT_505526 [Pelagophyceae sp. CCMP2097]